MSFPSGLILEIARAGGREPKQKGTGGEFFIRCPRAEQHRRGDANPSCRLNSEINTFYCDPCGQGGGVKDLAEALGVDLERFAAPRARKKTRASSRPKRPLVFESREPISSNLQQHFGRDLAKQYDPDTWQAFGVLEGRVYPQGRSEKSEGVIAFPLPGGGVHVYRYHQPNKKQRWRFANGGKADLIVVGLDRDDPVILAEGEWDAMRAYELGFAVATGTGAGTFKPEWADRLSGRRVAIVYDTDKAGRAGEAKAASALSCTAMTASVVLEFKNDEDGKDLSDFVRVHGHDQFRELIGTCVFGDIRDEQSSESQVHSRSQADRLVDYALQEDIELFHDQFDMAWARINVDGRAETWKCRSRQFKEWLARLFWMQDHKAVSRDVVSSALNVLQAEARFDGERHHLYNRVARCGDDLWYDLCDRQWRAVRVSRQGWEIVDQPPILFARQSHQLPQVAPQRGGDLHDLLRFVNIGDVRQHLLILVYVACCFVEEIGHPIPVIHGPQGSAKTTFLRMLRRLVDPSATETLSLPTKPNELIQQLAHHYFTPYDNLIGLPQWVSDTLCRAVTGEGFTKRELYTDDDDVIYSFRRCCALNGINPAAKRPDLLDRSILLGLEGIRSRDRKSEKAIWSEFDEARPLLLGAIFDVLSRAMTIHPTVVLDRLPRMADFAVWGAAIAEALGHARSEFLEAYAANLDARHEEVLANSPVAMMVQELVAEDQRWEGTPSELLKRLGQLAEQYEVNTKHQSWPKAAHVLTLRLNELRTNLAAVGIRIDLGRTARSRRITIEVSPDQGGRDALPVAAAGASSTASQEKVVNSSRNASDDAGDADDAVSGTSGGASSSSPEKSSCRSSSHPPPQIPRDSVIGVTSVIGSSFQQVTHDAPGDALAGDRHATPSPEDPDLDGMEVFEP
ncbi:MAG: toprim domain-containing protein [bacterium]|nr:toprim domain-containing protein [bacterium]